MLAQAVINATARLAYIAFFAGQWNTVDNTRLAINELPDMLLFAGLICVVARVYFPAQADKFVRSREDNSNAVSSHYLFNVVRDLMYVRDRRRVMLGRIRGFPTGARVCHLLFRPVCRAAVYSRNVVPTIPSLNSSELFYFFSFKRRESSTYSILRIEVPLAFIPKLKKKT